MSQLKQLKFDNIFVRSLPADESSDVGSRLVQNAIYSRVRPTPVSNPTLLTCSLSAASLLGLHLPENEKERKEWAEVFTGNAMIEGMEPHSTRYGGHQFGHWAGQLGDGRAISLGHVQNSRGERLEIQLKGAGPTPYSRRADGRAVLRSSLREYLCSEFMYHLRVPSTRALCCVLTGDAVIRDLFYNGNPLPEPGAITTRLAPCFLRFGHFEILAANGETQLLKKLIDHTIGNYFCDEKHSNEIYLQWYLDVCRKTAILLCEWMRVGFVHGVLNTDNMSILGLGVDYGPFGFLDDFDPDWTPNTTDFENRRYRFGQQPSVALWNLQCLASSLSPLAAEFGGEQKLLDGLDLFYREFNQRYEHMQKCKLGLSEIPAYVDEDRSLLKEMNILLQKVEIDMTIFFRRLGEIVLLANEGETESLTKRIDTILADAFYSAHQPIHFRAWISRYLKRIRCETQTPALIKQQMDQINPYFMLRNYLLLQAVEGIEKEQNLTQLKDLERALETPYECNANTQKFFKKRPDWARSAPGASALSCSS